jgi:hypothetical protein
MPTQAQNSSREIILPAYKAAISPGPPIPPLTRIEHQESLPLASSLFDFCRESCTNRRFFVQTNPICADPEYTLTSVPTKGCGNNAEFPPSKANPNEPKRTQSKPNFSLVRAPQSQNEPKQTQSKANFEHPRSLCLSLSTPRFSHHCGHRPIFPKVFGGQTPNTILPILTWMAH